MSLPDFNASYDPEFYDLTCEYVGPKDTDLNFLRKLVSEFGGPVLEVCVGTGRVAIPLAMDGFDITGIDRSERMLSRCAEKVNLLPTSARKRMKLVNAEMTGFKLGKKFRTAIIAFNTFLVLTTQKEQIACLSCIREHLQKSAGRLILDQFNPDLEMLTRNPEKKHLDFVFKDEDSGIIHECMSSTEYDDSTQIKTTTLFFTRTNPDGGIERDVQELRVRMLFPEEAILLLERCGFDIVYRWGNYERDEFSKGMERMIIVAKPKRK